MYVCISVHNENINNKWLLWLCCYMQSPYCSCEFIMSHIIWVLLVLQLKYVINPCLAMEYSSGQWPFPWSQWCTEGFILDILDSGMISFLFPKSLPRPRAVVRSEQYVGRTLLFFYSVFGQIGVQLSLNEVTKGILIIMFL